MLFFKNKKCIIYGIRKNVYLFKFRVETIFIFHLQEPIVRIELWYYVCVCVCVCVQLHMTLCDFSRQEYWSELPFPPPGYLPYPGIEPASPALTGRFFTTVSPGKPYGY